MQRNDWFTSTNLKAAFHHIGTYIPLTVNFYTLLIKANATNSQFKHLGLLCSPGCVTPNRDQNFNIFGQLASASQFQRAGVSEHPTCAPNFPRLPNTQPAAVEHLLTLRTTHVRGIINTETYLISRGDPLYGEWCLPQIAELIWKRYGRATIDLLAQKLPLSYVFLAIGQEHASRHRPTSPSLAQSAPLFQCDQTQWEDKPKTAFLPNSLAACLNHSQTCWWLTCTLRAQVMPSVLTWWWYVFSQAETSFSAKILSHIHLWGGEAHSFSPASFLFCGKEKAKHIVSYAGFEGMHGQD